MAITECVCTSCSHFSFHFISPGFVVDLSNLSFQRIVKKKMTKSDGISLNTQRILVAGPCFGGDQPRLPTLQIYIKSNALLLAYQIILHVLVYRRDLCRTVHSTKLRVGLAVDGDRIAVCSGAIAGTVTGSTIGRPNRTGARFIIIYVYSRTERCALQKTRGKVKCRQLNFFGDGCRFMDSQLNYLQCLIWLNVLMPMAFVSLALHGDTSGLKWKGVAIYGIFEMWFDYNYNCMHTIPLAICLLEMS